MKLEIFVPMSPPRLLTGYVLKICEPISFWGGVSPVDGHLTNPRSAKCGESIAGRILLIPELRGSSSASSVLLELAYKAIAPLAIVLGKPDAILALGAMVATEMQWQAPGIFGLDVKQHAIIPDNSPLSISPDGELRMLRP